MTGVMAAIVRAVRAVRAATKSELMTENGLFGGRFFMP